MTVSISLYNNEEYTNTNAEADILLNLYNNNKISTFDFKKFKNADLNILVSFIEIVSIKIFMNQKHKSFNKNFKLSYYSNLVSLLVNVVLTNIHKDQIFKQNIIYFLYILTIIEHGHKFLKQIKNILVFENEDLKKEILNISSTKGGFPAFLFWINFLKIDILKDNNNYIIINSINNSDDRLYKWTLEKIKENKSMLFHKNNIIKQMITNLLSSLIPTKHKLKKLKILSENCNLKPYLNVMLNNVTWSDFSIVKKLFKYYYHKPITFDEISDIITNYYLDLPSTEDYKTIYNKLITEQEKFYFQLIMMLRIIDDFGPENDINKLYFNKNDLIKNSTTIFNIITKTINESYNDDFTKIDTLDKLFNHETQGKKLLGTAIKILYKYDFFKHVFHKLYFENGLYNYLDNNIIFLISLSKFVPINNINGIKINKILHFLRLIVKKNTKSKIQNFQLKFFPVINELLNFKPSSKPILSKGSYNWQLSNQQFTNLPPRHLLPYEFNIYNNFLIREKVDGILINNLSTNIYPECNDLINYCIKAEYIENIDLYFIFDIDKPNTTIIERYNEIRFNHPYTNKTKLEIVSSTEELIKFIKNERIIFNKFLEETKKHQIRWYPKVAFLVNNCLEEFKKDIIQNIIVNCNTKLSKFINEEAEYKCDGLIISPINSNNTRDIKIKPKNMMTIDLLYDGLNWLDKEKNKYGSIIMILTKPKQGKIYRCYPIDNDKYQAKEIRFDKRYPNNFDVINVIQTIYKYDWSNLNYSKYDWSKLYSIKKLKKQSEIFTEQIEKISPELNKNWLDLGCGKCILTDIIKKYSPKKYVGLDSNIDDLLYSINQNNNDWINLSICDLKENWFENSKWYNIKNIKFDYIIINWSIMNLFETRQFKKCLTEVSKYDTKIIFNR